MRISRPATREDIDEVVRLAAVMFSSMDLDATDPAWLTAAREALDERLGQALAVYVVDHPEGGGRLASSAAGSVLQRLPTPGNVTGVVGHVQWVATEPDLRGRGFGREVMTALLQWFGERSVKLVELHATPDGEPLYRSLGFEAPGNPHLVRVAVT